MNPLFLIVAVANNGIIGKDNTIPWKMPEDLKYFRKTTLGHSIIMGRKCWESIGGKPLKDRINIVLSNTLSKKDLPEDVILYQNLDEAIIAGQRYSAGLPPFIIGGAEIYRQSLPLVTDMYITEIPLSPADNNFPSTSKWIRFPEWNKSEWNLTSSHIGESGACFKIYKRL